MLTSLIILIAIASGSAIAGGVLGYWQNFHPGWMRTETRHFVIAFGGGALLAAVSLVLVPNGLELQSHWAALLSFGLGAAAFMTLDRMLKKRGAPMSQLIAMLLDFIPEAIVVGAVISENYAQALFLTIIISAQNIPEAFNAFREITKESDDQKEARRALAMIAIAASSGIIWGLLGFYTFSPDSASLGAVMTFCAGGIIYLVFRDIAPEANLENKWYPPFGAVLGFMVGMAGHAYVG